jgi:hypothetical protein
VNENLDQGWSIGIHKKIVPKIFKLAFYLLSNVFYVLAHCREIKAL